MADTFETFDFDHFVSSDFYQNYIGHLNSIDLYNCFLEIKLRLSTLASSLNRHFTLMHFQHCCHNECFQFLLIFIFLLKVLNLWNSIKRIWISISIDRIMSSTTFWLKLSVCPSEITGLEYCFAFFGQMWLIHRVLENNFLGLKFKMIAELCIKPVSWSYIFYTRCNIVYFSLWSMEMRRPFQKLLDQESITY